MKNLKINFYAVCLVMSFTACHQSEDAQLLLIHNDLKETSVPYFIGKHVEKQEVTLFDVSSGKTFFTHTSKPVTLTVDCFGEQKKLELTAFASYPGWFANGMVYAATTIALTGHHEGFGILTFQPIKQATTKQKVSDAVAASGLLQELIKKDPELVTDMTLRVKDNKPDVYEINIPAMEVYVASYPIEYSRLISVAAIYVVINGKAFNFTASQGVLDFYTYILDGRYYIKTGMSDRLDITATYEITKDGLLPIQNETYPCVN